MDHMSYTKLGLLVAAAATWWIAATPAVAQSTPVLSRNQINLVNGIETIASIRMEPRRTPIATTLAGALEEPLLDAYDAYFGDFPNTLARGASPVRRSEVGRLICRVYARDESANVAIFMRCILGNLSVNIMDRGDILLTAKHQAIPKAQAMMEDIVRRLAYSFLQAHGMKPRWTPEAALTRDEVLGIGRRQSTPQQSPQ